MAVNPSAANNGFTCLGLIMGNPPHVIVGQFCAVLKGRPILPLLRKILRSCAMPTIADGVETDESSRQTGRSVKRHFSKVDAMFGSPTRARTKDPDSVSGNDRLGSLTDLS